MKNILVTSFGVNPCIEGKPSAAWNLILQSSRSNRIILVTSARNKEGIEAYLSSNRKQKALFTRLDIQYFDVLPVFNFLLGFRSLRPLFFYIWQMGVALHLLGRTDRTDICHDLNMYTGLIPSFLWILGKPFVWGPVMASADRSRICSTRKETIYCKIFRALSRVRWKMDPFLLVCRARAEKILYANEEARQALLSAAGKLEFMPISGAEIPVAIPDSGNCFRVVSFGDPYTTGSHDKVIHAFRDLVGSLDEAQRPGTCLQLVARPDEKRRLEELVSTLQLQPKVQVMDPLSKFDRNQMLQKASAVVAAGLHDYDHPSAEAQSFGLPLICTHHGADPYIHPDSKLKILATGMDDSVRELSAKLRRLHDSAEFLQKEKQLAAEHFFRFYRWTSKREQLEKIYHGMGSIERLDNQWSHAFNQQVHQ